MNNFSRAAVTTGLIAMLAPVPVLSQNRLESLIDNNGNKVTECQDTDFFWLYYQKLKEIIKEYRRYMLSEIKQGEHIVNIGYSFNDYLLIKELAAHYKGMELPERCDDCHIYVGNSIITIGYGRWNFRDLNKATTIFDIREKHAEKTVIDPKTNERTVTKYYVCPKE